MNKLTRAFLAVFCMTAILVGCGESPTAPSVDVPLNSAPAIKQWTQPSTADTVPLKYEKPDKSTLSGYAIAM